MKEKGLAMAENPQDIHKFKDLKKDHWGYYEMIEATNTHVFFRLVEGQVEEGWRHVITKE